MIQHLILEGHTTDAIEKTKELFPTLLNNKNLLFTLKVRQFIEMINGTESEISSPSVSSQPTSNYLVLKTRKSSSRSSSPITKPQASSHSRSNSPYTQPSNRTIHSSSRRSSANNTELTQNTSIESHSNNTVPNLMDIDDDLYGPSTSNGFANHGTVAHSSGNSISNGHSLIDDGNNLNSNGCTSDKLDSMDHDGMNDGNTELNSMDDQLLVRILQFGKELHALKQQLHNEYGENTQNDKMLQVKFH